LVTARSALFLFDGGFNAIHYSVPFDCHPSVPSSGRAQGPVGVISKEGSSIKFNVKASVPIDGTFDKWDATLTFASTDVTSGVLDVKIQAASVNTGSGMKDGKLTSKDFFDAEHDPLITFHSKKISQTGPDSFNIDGDFTIRGVTKGEQH
jgi:polyisoprenoid-binding protein YceI